MFIPFDILYEGFCNRIRSSGKSDAILQLIKKENSDNFRVRALLEEEPDLYSLLVRNISDSFERKDDQVANKLWRRGTDGKSLELLTEALAYFPIPQLFEEKVVPAFDSPEQCKVVLQKFINCPMKENETVPESASFATIIYGKGCVLFCRKLFVSACTDFMTAWLLGLSKTLELTYQVAVCCFESRELDIAKELLQCCAQHLRTLPMTNDLKSEWTMNIVTVLKAIETVRKHESHQNAQRLCDRLMKMAIGEETFEVAGFSTLFSGESEQIRGSSNSIELKYSVEKGRHMIAKQSIPPGSTIIVEMPYAWTMSKSSYHKFCTWCLQKIVTGIPCSQCASVMFCNATCRNLAMNAFHGKECQILKLLDSSQKLGSMALLCFRTILMTPLCTALEYAKYLYKDSVIPLQTVMGLNEDGKFDSSSYLSVFSQTSNSSQRQAGDLLKRTFSAIYLTLCLKYTGYFKSDSMKKESKPSDSSEEITEKMSEAEIDIAALILRHLQGASCNAYGINYIEAKKYMTEEEDYEKNLHIDEIGGATYPIISTTNHSCNPNAYRINIPGRLCVVKSLREIREGEEVFDSYGPIYLMEPRQERISKLQAQYIFRCKCIPCSDDWPSYGNLRKLPTHYKCSSCQCGLKVNGNAKGVQNKVKCPYCDKVTDMKKLLANLSTQKERFTLARQSILGEVFQPFDKDLEEVIIHYIRLCETAYLDPSFHTIEAQEVLKLFWNLSIRNA